ncbi:hypothetical protein AVEN_190608-1 [Araneus ventricosus]|uniref:Uncharacterized protein n=1 Tax=Araneus ventricosus TaxID=182803 RepID=A0A4Y2CD65_ARAVE|nr:hypothetical protein AVEN_190608-1 [Araneus ventricosus]
MFDTLVTCEDQLDLLTSATAETVNEVSERRLAKEQFHRHLYSFEPGDLVLYDWPKKCDRKLTTTFKGPFVIVRPVRTVCYENKSVTEQRKFRKVVHVQHPRAYYEQNTPKYAGIASSEEQEEEAVEVDDHANVPGPKNLHRRSKRFAIRRNRRPSK